MDKKEEEKLQKQFDFIEKRILKFKKVFCINCKHISSIPICRKMNCKVRKRIDQLYNDYNNLYIGIKLEYFKNLKKKGTI